MYLGRIVEQGSAPDVIERPASSLHPGAGRRPYRCPRPGRRTTRAAAGELPDATDVPPGCRFHPRCPRRFAPCDQVDPALIATGGRRPARRLSPARSGPRDGGAGRWRLSSAGAGSRPRRRDVAGAAKRDHGRPRRARRPRPGGQRSSAPGSPLSRRPRCRRRRGGDGQRHGGADGEARDRGTRDDRDLRPPVRDTRRRHRLPGGGPGLRQGPGRRCHPGRRRMRRRRDGRFANGGRRRRRAGARTPRPRRRGGKRGRGHRHDLLWLPWRHRDRLALGGRPPPRGVAAVQLRRPRLSRLGRARAGPPGPGPADRGLLHRGLRDRRARFRPRGFAAWRLRPLLGLARAGSYAPTARERSASPSRRPPAARSPASSSTPTSPRHTRPPANPSTTAWSRPGQRERRDGTMQEGFPTDAVRALREEAG